MSDTDDARMEMREAILDAVLNYLPNPEERRRYALLQAAAILLPKYIDVASAEAAVAGYDAYLRAQPRRIAVTEAFELLAEIERREKAEGSVSHTPGSLLDACRRIVAEARHGEVTIDAIAICEAAILKAEGH